MHTQLLLDHRHGGSVYQDLGRLRVRQERAHLPPLAVPAGDRVGAEHPKRVTVISADDCLDFLTRH